KQVLVVEDDPALRRLIALLLEDEGYAVLAAGTGEQALAIAHSLHPDTVVLDLGLPDIDGREVASRMRDDGVDAEVIVLSARSDGRQCAREIGARSFIGKPFEPGDLTRSVARA